MRVLVCGSRTWGRGQQIFDRVGELSSDAVVIHGGADGADALAERAARYHGLHTAIVYPRWQLHGKRAGHIRNGAMLDLQPDLVIAFTQGTNGTQGTIDEARRRGIPVEVHGTEAA